MILLDTVVLSELRERDASPNLVRWLSDFRDSDLFLSVVSIGEIESGIERKRKSDPPFAESLTRWIENLLRLYGDRVLPVTASVIPALGYPFRSTGE